MKEKTLSLLLLALMAAATPAAADRSVNERCEVAADGTVEVENVSGTIQVEGWSRNEVEITGTLGEEVERLDVECGADKTVVEVVLPKRTTRKADGRLVLKVPAGSRVDVETVSAAIAVEGVTGALDLESVSGTIKARGDLDEVDLETVSGSIDFSGSADKAEAESVSGKITLAGIRGEFKASTVSADIDVEAQAISRGELESVSGRTVVTGDLARGGRLSVENHSGTVELRLPSGTSADFRVSTFSGSISNDFGPAPKSGRGPGKTLEFSTGGGGQIEVESFSGAVRLKAN